MRQALILSAAFLALAGPSHAQDEDEDSGGFLTRTIEDALSGAGREVELIGFAGALSSEATFEKLTIADDQGVWLTLDDVVLNWRRAALLRGNLVVNSLTAASLEIVRLPDAGTAPVETPSAEAEEFSLQLPELPVSINLAAFEIARIDLGEPILGVPAQLALNASARLDDEGLFLDVKADRTDQVAGGFAIATTVLRDGAEIDINVSLEEAEGGLVARLLKLPDLPSVDLDVAGQGTLDDFTADIGLATDGASRLAGQVILAAEATDADRPNRRIRADIGGDITALIVPEYESFFGPDVGLSVNTLLLADGSISVDAFDVDARVLDLSGTVQLNKDMWPSFLHIDGEIAEAGAPVALPGADLTVTNVSLDVSYDVAQGDRLEGSFDIQGLDHLAAKVDQLTLELDGTLDGTVDAVGQLAADITFAATGLALQDPEVAEALGGSVQGGARVSYVEDAPIEISGLTLSGEDYGLNGDVEIAGLDGGFPTDLTLEIAARDLSRFSSLAGQDLSGAAELSVEGSVTPLSSIFDLAISGLTRDLAVSIPEADGVMKGQTTLSLQAARGVDGTFVRDLKLNNRALDVSADVALRTGGSDVDASVRLSDLGLVVPDYSGPVELIASAEQIEGGWWQVDTDLRAPYGTTAQVAGLATGPEADLNFDVTVPDVRSFVPELEGPVQAQGRLWQSEQGYQVDVDATGPFQTALTVVGLATGPEADLGFNVSVPDVSQFAEGIEGPFLAKGRVWQAETGYQVDVNAQGPFDSTADVDGLATGSEADLDFDISVPEVNLFVEGVNGPLLAKGRVWQTTQGYNVDVGADAPFDAMVDVEGLVTGPDARINLRANLPDMGVLLPELAGALALTGEVVRAGESWDIRSQLEGPGGLAASVAGSAMADGSTVDIKVTGDAPTALAAPFIAPATISGPAAFDLTLNGAPGLDALSGQITTTGVSVLEPNFGMGLDDINTRVDLANSAAQLDVGATIPTGGRLEVGGTVDLTSLVGDISVALIDAEIVDPKLLAASLEANLNMNGPLAGGATISGVVNLEEVNVTVPGTGSTPVGSIPEIRHVGSSATAIATRERAGVEIKEVDETARGPGAVYGLDIDVNAPSQIFIRGRGINAEMGGDLQLRGQSDNVISSGGFDLIRGRIDVIGKRFDLDEGSVQFQGNLTPYIRFVTTTDTPEGTASITVDGPATEPEITFSADPEAPEDEVLALILFGRYVSELSAFQALQLANGVAQLTGRGGINLIGNLRAGIGLDELDVTTDEEGQTSVSAGKYITDDIYTDVTTNSEDGTDISLNIDLTESLTGKATVAEDGDGSVGLFFQRDY